MFSSQMPIYTHYPIRVRHDDRRAHIYRCESLQTVHAYVLQNFTRSMSCSTDDIIDVKYSISSIKDCHSRCYDINALTVYVSDGYSYTFTREYCPDADGLLSDISYYSYIDMNTDYTDDDEWDWTEHRVIYQEVTKLPKSIKQSISLGLIEGDINVLVPPVKSSFVKHHKVWIKKDRRRREGNQDIYKEWDETIHYYSVKLLTPLIVPESIDQPIDIDTEPLTLNLSDIRIGWSDDDY